MVATLAVTYPLTWDAWHRLAASSSATSSWPSIKAKSQAVCPFFAARSLCNGATLVFVYWFYSCWPRLQAVHGPCRDVLLRLQSTKVTSHHHLPCLLQRHMQAASGQFQTDPCQLQQTVALILSGPSLNQEADNVKMPCLSHNMQRCPPWFSGTVGPCPIRFQSGNERCWECWDALCSHFPSAPTSPRRRMVGWPLKAAPKASAHLNLIFLCTSSNSFNGAVCPCSAAWCSGVSPALSVTLGVRGCCNICSSETASFFFGVEMSCWSCSSSDGQKSKVTSWTLTEARAKTVSSGISEPSKPSASSFCRNLVTPTLAAKHCFTYLADFPLNSSGSRNASVSPETAEHTSMAAIARSVKIRKIFISCCIFDETYWTIEMYRPTQIIITYYNDGLLIGILPNILDRFG